LEERSSSSSGGGGDATVAGEQHCQQHIHLERRQQWTT